MELTLADGHTLGYELYGKAGGRPVIGMHGTPGSRYHRFPLGDPYAAAGVQAAVFDRPGFGLSSRRPDRCVADAATWTAQFANHLGWDRFAVIGGSGGGPHALACAALLPGRVTRVLCRVSPAPWGAAGLDYFAGMNEGNVLKFKLALGGEAALRPVYETESAALLGRLDGDMRLVFGPDYQLADADRLMLAQEAIAGKMRQSFAEAFRHGVDGWVDDSLAFAKPWGFDLASISVPVRLVYGKSDTLVPAAHGAWLAEHVPGAQVEVSPDGHLSDMDPAAAERQLRWLASDFN